jgi:hypothetical protein
MGILFLSFEYCDSFNMDHGMEWNGADLICESAILPTITLPFFDSL